MGKKKNSKKFGEKVGRPGPLFDQIQKAELASQKLSAKLRGKRALDGDKFIEGELSKNIIKQSLDQLRELEKDEGNVTSEVPTGSDNYREGPKLKQHEDSDDDVNDEDRDDSEKISHFSVDNIISDFEKELNIDDGDKNVLDHFIINVSGPQRKLAELFREKISEKHTEVISQLDSESISSVTVNPEVQELCKEMGLVLAKYRSGALPKMFKVMPKMRNWEELVYLTNPDKWSAAAMYQGTRIFVSGLKQAMAQRFFNLVLLPRVRDDIAFYKRLNYHIYQTLCKALFKPAAFFKGILLPLCMSGTCTLREAIIIGSVIARCHIPILHSAAALLKIAEMDYTGPNSIFIRILLDKKYALPYRVIDAVVYHFIKFENDKRELPVLWHQAFLTFVQRYKEDISSDQKDALMSVLKFHGHYKITPQIRRELQNSRCRDDPATTNSMEVN